MNQQTPRDNLNCTVNDQSLRQIQTANGQPGTELLREFANFLEKQTGLYFPPERWPDMLRGMSVVTRELKRTNITDCMQWLQSAPFQMRHSNILAANLTIGETYFFRDIQVFYALQTHVLPPLIESRRNSDRTLRILSAGCSSGEEAYSLAILLQRLIPDYKQWRITIIGTDFNPRALHKAEIGIYEDWSFRNSPDWLQVNYFRKLGKRRYKISENVQKMVSFSCINLAHDIFPTYLNSYNTMDIIFCRNVLMYFTPKRAAQIIHKYGESLHDHGWLVVSPAESGLPGFEHMDAVNFPGAILHRKKTAGSYTLDETPNSSEPQIFRPVGGFTESPPSPNATPRSIPPYSAISEPGAKSILDTKQSTARSNNVPLTSEEQLYHKPTNDPYSPHALREQVKIHADRGNHVEAQQWSERAIAADRVNPSTHYLSAVVWHEKGNPDEAIAALKRTLYLEPDFVLAHFMLGNLYRLQGKHQEASKHYTNTLNLLQRYARSDLLPDAEGVTAGSLAALIHTITGEERASTLNESRHSMPDKTNIRNTK